MVKGVVKKYIQEKGYGFIAGDDGKRVFVHQSIPPGAFPYRDIQKAV